MKAFSHLSLSFLFVVLPFSFASSAAAQSSDAKRALQIHNQARQAVKVAPLQWSPQLARSAQRYAEKLARKDRGLEHSRSDSSDRSRNVGENLYALWSSSPGLVTRRLASCYEAATRSWLAERAIYVKKGQPRIQRAFFSRQKDQMVGHYTQMVWSDTTQIGFGKAVSRSGKLYVVAHYNPVGNYIGEHPYH